MRFKNKRANIVRVREVFPLIFPRVLTLNNEISVLWEWVWVLEKLETQGNNTWYHEKGSFAKKDVVFIKDDNTEYRVLGNLDDGNIFSEFRDFKERVEFNKERWYLAFGDFPYTKVGY